MKKTTLIMIASASMLFAAPAMDSNMSMQGKGMGQNCKGMKMMKCKCKGPKMGQGMQGNKMMQGKMIMKKKMNSPFLIKHGLPHLSKMIMPFMEDPGFALTADQKEKLAKVRTETMGAIMEIKPEVVSLRKSIVNASASGTSSADLKEKVEKLASLEAKATMVHLKCIEETKAILTKDQLLYLLVNKNRGMMHSKQMPMRNGKGRMRMNMAR